jgi:aminoglycoside phosphotransferase family enzyme/predicted kinase
LDPKLQAGLIDALCNPAHFGNRCERVRLLETHISYVLLTGAYAYKIKKAIQLGFLDFSTLAARRFYCEQELRLNRRLAPALYLDVVAITGSTALPEIGGSGPILDYAVKMREFPQQSLLSNVLDRNALTTEHIDHLAAIVARFHGQIAVAAADSSFGTPDNVLKLALANFAEIRALVMDAEERDDLDQLETWTRSEYAARGETIATRRQTGFVRECHGDLHLGNIAFVDDVITIFDCIEFNDRMRWIDVMSEVAFTVMDLEHRRRRAYAQRFLNAYLEATGDYGGVAVLRFYVVYRAMVRAKVAFLRAAQLADGDAKRALQRDYHDHVRLAKRYAAAARPAVVITHGFAGCGKTTLSQVLLEQFGAIRIRTDVERKRLHGLGAHDNSRSGIDKALYAPEVTRTTYDHVATLARTIAASSFTALVDGAFLRRWQRDLFRSLATELHVPFVVVDVSASETTLLERVRQRERSATDASEAGVAVLEQQLRSHDPLGFDEYADVVAYDGELHTYADGACQPTSNALLARIFSASSR